MKAPYPLYEACGANIRRSSRLVEGLATEFGFNTVANSQGIRPDVLAREVEARGFDSLWFGDHSYIPRRPQEGHGAHPGGGTREEFRHMYDMTTVMSVAAMATTTLKVGSLACLLTIRNPLTTAKALATIDVLSGGRLLVGVGTGWHPEELANNGVAFNERYAVFRERVLAVQELWRNEHAEFHGEYVDFDPVYAYPQPFQSPRPPVIACFDGPVAIRRMIEWSDGWSPTTNTLSDREGGLAGFTEKVGTVRRYLEEAGRDPATYPISPTVRSAWHSQTELLDVDPRVLEQLRELGMSRLMFGIPPGPEDAVLSLLDHYAKYVEH